ncbi:MAG: hypothetical protein R2867_01970 [Caldilineaceae bacterium]
MLLMPSIYSDVMGEGPFGSRCPLIDLTSEAIPEKRLEYSEAGGNNEVLIRIESITANIGDIVTTHVFANVTERTLGMTTVEIRYNPDQLRAQSCSADPNSVFGFATCNPTFVNDGAYPR